jgi:WD40 repeat protein
LRVVNGDSSGDRMLAAPVAPVAPAWRPGTHSLAYVSADGTLHVVDADTGRRLASLRDAGPQQLAWSSDGRLLAAREDGVLAVYRPDLTRVSGISTRSLAPGNPFTALAFRPHSDTLAWSTYDPRTDTSTVAGGPINGAQRRIFSGAGRVTTLAWSDDGRWLALDWRDADQLLFIRSTKVRRIVAIANVGSSLGGRAALGGWCCP